MALTFEKQIEIWGAWSGRTESGQQMGESLGGVDDWRKALAVEIIVMNPASGAFFV